jgi:hypothetical protein
MHKRTQEQTLDKLLAEESGSAELIARVKESLTKTINLTDKTADDCYVLIESRGLRIN